MTKIFVMFVRQGFLGPQVKNKFLLAYLLGLKNTMYPKNATGADSESKIDPRDLIGITWSLICLQKTGSMSIPLIPKLLEQLKTFNRPEQPLSSEELLMLHQISAYIDDLVLEGKMPSQYTSILPHHIKEAA